ncbi:hypothetical protein [Cobetia marina]|uniref:hypothetical protein n=1 Tax=Cobetia marina TaxID=28258 RepID=UPI0011445250|nr:hypothetical protein [Cobetia marina]GED41463.1 hypothetical protein HHA02_07920 [Cobetia marina]
MVELSEDDSFIDVKARREKAAILIHTQIIKSGGYPKPAQAVQVMLRKPEHPNHPFGLDNITLSEVLKKRHLEIALGNLGFIIEDHRVIGLEGVSNLLEQ